MSIKEYSTSVEMPEGVSASVSDGFLAIKKGKNEVKRKLLSKQVAIKIDGNQITLSFKDGSKREKCMANTFAAHFRNMIKGVTEGHMYKLKICASHFPMTVAVKGNKFSVTNFLGEKIPREMKIKEGAEMKIEGDIITITSINLETAAQIAADIEQLTKVSNRDRRIFQDGIYITEKDGKRIE